VALLALDLLEDGLAPVLDLADLLLEALDEAADAAHVVLARRRGRALAPEEGGAADLPELLQRPAHVVQQAMLPAVRGEVLELAVDPGQVVHERVEPRAGLCELREEPLLILAGHGIHELPQTSMEGDTTDLCPRLRR